MYVMSVCVCVCVCVCGVCVCGVCVGVCMCGCVFESLRVCILTLRPAYVQRKVMNVQ